MKKSPAPTLAALLLLAAVIAYRLCAGFEGGQYPWLENFAPVAAVALCGAIYLPRKMALFLPLAALFFSDVILNAFHYHAAVVSMEMVARYVALALTVGIGWALPAGVPAAGILLASLAGSLLFYTVTNTASWCTEPGYAKTPGGWVQALTTGVPGYEPTWMFFRSTLFSDLLFTGLFIACMAAARKQAAPASQAPELVATTTAR